MFYRLLIVTGSLIFLFSLSFDWFFDGSPGIGFQQLAGMTIGLVVTMTGLRPLIFPARPQWDWILFGIYFCGILVVGLRPDESGLLGQGELIGFGPTSKKDLVLNLAGFVPLGFLLMSLSRLYSNNGYSIALLTIAALFGFITSLTIEVSQYFWIPGRYSSALDLATNTVGVIVGALGFQAFTGQARKSGGP